MDTQWMAFFNTPGILHQYHGSLGLVPGVGCARSASGHTPRGAGGATRVVADEIARWDDISRKMVVPFHADGLISQFEGYEELQELDWDSYRARYGNIQRLELILEAENDSANRYKLEKQPDVLMFFMYFRPRSWMQYLRVLVTGSSSLPI